MSTPGRYKAHEINAMNIEDSHPMAKWVCPEEPRTWRLSDSYIGKLYSHCSIVEEKMTLAIELAPVTFTAKALHIRTTGKVINLGSPFLYDGAYVTFNGYVLCGDWDPALLPSGRPLEQLVQDREFEFYIQRVMFGDYHLFTPEILKSDLNLLRSVTSTSPGMIGSTNPPGPGPYFGVDPALFTAAASVVPSSAASGGDQSPVDPFSAPAGAHPSASGGTHPPVGLSSAVSESEYSLSSAASEDELIIWPPPPPKTPKASKASKTSRERPEAVSPQPVRRSERISRGPAGGYTTPLPSTPQFQPLALPDRSVSPVKPVDPRDARLRTRDIFGNLPTEIPALMPRIPLEPAYHGRFTVPGRSRDAPQQFDIPEGWGSHSRTVSMPNVPTNFGQSSVGAMMPTRTSRNEQVSKDIADIIEAEYGPAPAEDRLEPPRRRSIARSNVTMGGMGDSIQSNVPSSPGFSPHHFAPTSPGFSPDHHYVPTSPDFSPARTRKSSPMSVARGSNSVGSRDPQAQIYANHEAFFLRDTESGEDERYETFSNTLRDAKQATRVSARSAVNARSYQEAKAMLMELDQELIEIMAAKFQALREKRDAGGFLDDRHE